MLLRLLTKVSSYDVESIIIIFKSIFAENNEKIVIKRRKKTNFWALKVAFNRLLLVTGLLLTDVDSY